jgi:Mrp family chromosome partitioning ATPase
VRAGKTPREQVVRARDKIYRSRASVLGVVLNGLDLTTGGYGYGGYRYAYYGPGAEEPAGPKAVQTS